MPIEKPSNTENLPKILLVDEKTNCTLQFDDQNIEKVKIEHEDQSGKKVMWSAYMVEDMQVFDEDGEEIEEGTNEIPFYGMEAFFDCYNLLTSKQLKGPIVFSFRRIKSGSKNKFKFEVDL